MGNWNLLQSPMITDLWCPEGLLRSAADKEIAELLWVRALQFNMGYKSLSAKPVSWYQSQAFSALGLSLALVVQAFDSLGRSHCCHPLRIATQPASQWMLPDTTVPLPSPELQPCPGLLSVWCSLALTPHQRQPPAHQALSYLWFFLL